MANPAPVGRGAAPIVTFDTLTLDQAKALVEGSLPVEADINELFVSGDHWQEAKGWIGPQPSLDDEDVDTTMELIRTGFTSRNVVLEIVRRRMRGVVGREPSFGVAPRAVTLPGTQLTDAQVRAKAEIEAALTDWWDTNGVHQIIQSAVQRVSWATRAPLRLFVPNGMLDDNGEVPLQSSLEDALRFIFIEAPEPTAATVDTDADTRDEIGILFTQIDGAEAVELCYLSGTASETDRPTIIRTVTKDPNDPQKEQSEEFELELGGRITMTIIAGDLLITEQQQQMQRALNLCMSMIPHNIITGGFLERVILNALPPGHWEEGERGGKKKFVREPYVTGPGITSWVRGLELPQKDGTSQVTAPSVAYREPTDPEFASKAKRSIYQDMLEEADQAHILITGDATASGKSREQARADFENSLTELEAPTNRAGRWVIETVLAMAESFMRQPGLFLDEWRGQFDCRITSGPISIEERAQNVAEVTAELLSRETAMERNGVADVEAEQSRITEQEDELGTLDSQAQIVERLANAGASIEGAAEVAGIENPGRLIPTDVPPANPPPAPGNPPENNPPAPTPPQQ